MPPALRRLQERLIPNTTPTSMQTWAVRLLVIFTLLIGTLVVAGVAYAASRHLFLNSPFAIGGEGPVIKPGTGQPASDQQSTFPSGGEGPVLSSVDEPALTPWDGSTRVTVLLLGLDYRDWEADQVASRSDTMILLSLDPLTRSASILSIPRDLWVPIPGYTHAKINTAYYLGDAHKLPGGGPGLAVKTVEQVVGVPIHYYAQIDFAAFVRFIDEIGGVKIDVPEPIKIDLLGDGADTIKTLKPGVQVLPGEWALAYARNRKTEGGDFDRAARQQQVILGIRDRILSLDMLTTMIGKAPTLYQELASGIRTNLTVQEVIKLAVLAQEVESDDIKQGVIGQKQVVFGTSPDGLSILIPIPDKIILLRDELFATGAGLGPMTPGSSRERMQAEGAILNIYNGSRVGDLGTRSEMYLKSQGVKVAQVANAPEPYASTTLIDHTGSPYLLQYLMEVYGINPRRVFLEYDPNSLVDVEIYLGYDAEGANLN